MYFRNSMDGGSEQVKAFIKIGMRDCLCHPDSYGQHCLEDFWKDLDLAVQCTVQSHSVELWGFEPSLQPMWWELGTATNLVIGQTAHVGNPLLLGMGFDLWVWPFLWCKFFIDLARIHRFSLQFIGLEYIIAIDFMIHRFSPKFYVHRFSLQLIWLNS